MDEWLKGWYIIIHSHDPNHISLIYSKFLNWKINFCSIIIFIKNPLKCYVKCCYSMQQTFDDDICWTYDGRCHRVQRWKCRIQMPDYRAWQSYGTNSVPTVLPPPTMFANQNSEYETDLWSKCNSLDFQSSSMSQFTKISDV